MGNDPRIIEQMLQQTNDAYLAGYAEFEQTLSECHRIETTVNAADIKAIKQEVNRLMPVQDSIVRR